MTDLLPHVLTHTRVAREALDKAIRLMEEHPEPGLMTWWGFLDRDLQTAADEIATAQVAP
jgi:hypothetical protein